MDAEGNRKCGGEGCNGLTTLAHNTWQKAKDFDQDIISAMEEVDKLSKMVSDPMNIANTNYFSYNLAVRINPLLWI